MSIEIFDMDQRSPEWFETRSGIPTASEFSTVMASGKSGAPSKTRDTYMRKLAGEIITGSPMEGFTNGHMERGIEMEAEARSFYVLMTDTEPVDIGFLRNGRKGASPDAMIGDDGLLEIKTTLPHLLIEHLLNDAPPKQHTAQIQGQLWVSERQWCDLVVYWPGMPFFCKRIERDEEYIATMSRAVDLFNEDLDAMVDRVKAYGS